MLENVTTFLKNKGKKEQPDKSKDAAKERLHLVLMQDRANVSADFLDMMKQEIVDVIKKYIDVDEKEMNVKLENRTNTDGTTGAPALFANIPIMGINEEKKKESEEITKARKLEEEKKAVEEEEKIAKKKTTKTAKASTAATAAKKTTTRKKVVEDDGTEVVKVKKTVKKSKE